MTTKERNVRDSLLSTVLLTMSLIRKIPVKLRFMQLNFLKIARKITDYERTWNFKKKYFSS